MASRSARHQALADLGRRVADCGACPRLVAHREQIGRAKRRAYLHETYWARAVPSFGDLNPHLLIVGLAPAAHGANRTGRMFTGDSSGDWLYRALHKVGFANQAEAASADDGLQLSGAYITATAHCAPPDNKPSREELARCRPFLLEEFRTLLPVSARDTPLVVLALGGIAHLAALSAMADCGVAVPKPRPRFGHAAEWRASDRLVLLDSYHPSRQNTQTGRLTEAMFDRVFARARALCDQACQ